MCADQPSQNQQFETAAAELVRKMKDFIQSSVSFRTCCDTVVQMRQNQANPVLLQSSLLGRIMSIVYLFIANQS